jgi:hypothetical protein
MRVIFQNFSAGQQGRGQALYSTMWGLGVAFGLVSEATLQSTNLRAQPRWHT